MKSFAEGASAKIFKAKYKGKEVIAKVSSGSRYDMVPI